MKKIIFSLFAFLFVSSLCFAQQASAPASKLTPAPVETKPLAGKVDKGDRIAKIKLLQDSAAALQKSNPDLAKGLSDYADKEAKKMQEWKAKHDAKVKLLQDASTALQKSNPDLAKGLQEMCAGKPKSEMQKMMQEKNEKEEVGEKVEPKSEQGETK
jgi:hypothetical protein